MGRGTSTAPWPWPPAKTRELGIHHHTREDTGGERAETSVGPAAECDEDKKGAKPPARAVITARTTHMPAVCHTTRYARYAMPAERGIGGAGSTTPSGRTIRGFGKASDSACTAFIRVGCRMILYMIL